MTFRSPMLQAHPSRTDTRRRLSRVRLLLVLVPLGLAGLVAALVAWRLPPVTGWGHALYWCHDHLYLPLKGHLYTRFLPYSIPVWTTLLLCLLLWLIAFLGRRALLHHLHLALLQATVRTEPGRRMVLAGARFLSARGYPPRLTSEVARYVRRTLLQAVPADDTADPGPRAAHGLKVAELTLFQLQLAALPGTDAATRYDTLAAFQEGFAVMRRGLPADRARLRAQTAAAFAALWAPTDAASAPSATGDPHPLSLEGFVTDLLALAAAFEPELTRLLPDGPRPDLPPAALEDAAATRLAVSADGRRVALDRLRLRLEDGLLRFRGPAAAADDPFAHLPPEHLPLWGGLAMGLALDLALLDGTPAPALAHIDTLEALRLALALQAPEAADAPHTAHARAFMEGLPAPRHLALCAALGRVRLQDRLSQWRASGLARADLVRAEDYAPAHRALQDLWQAAGAEPAADGPTAEPA